jgi:hypothetical protein
LNERRLYLRESSINSSAPLSLQAHQANAADRVRGVASFSITPAMMNEFALRRKR